MRVLELLYMPDEVNKRYKDITASVNMDKGDTGVVQSVTIWESFTDPNLRRAGLLGVALMVG